MGSKVFANGREIASGKAAASGSPIAAYPDTCLVPAPPAPMVPTPYPNIATAEGARTGIASSKVKIGGKEAMSKNASHFKKSTGDEAGTSSLKGGVVTSKPQVPQKIFRHYNQSIKVASWGRPAAVKGPSAVRSPAARKGVAVGTGSATQEPAAGVNAPRPIACGNPKCPHYTARVPATQTAQLPAEKAQEHGLLSAVVCLECYRKFAGLEPKPAATGG